MTPKNNNHFHISYIAWNLQAICLAFCFLLFHLFFQFPIFLCLILIGGWVSVSLTTHKTYTYELMVTSKLSNKLIQFNKKETSFLVAKLWMQTVKPQMKEEGKKWLLDLRTKQNELIQYTFWFWLNFLHKQSMFSTKHERTNE